MSIQRIITDLKLQLHDRGVDWMVVGGWALAAHGVARQTFDLDVVIAKADGRKAEAALETCGYALLGRSALMSRYRSSTPGSPDIDVLAIDPATMATLGKEAIITALGSENIRVPTLMHLLAMKIHAFKSDPTRRTKDVSDIVSLVRANGVSPSSEEFHSLCAKYGSEELWKEIVALAKTWP